MRVFELDFCRGGGELTANYRKPFDMIAVTNGEYKRKKVTSPEKNDLLTIWQGCQDSNLGMPESKSGALPLGDTPKKEMSLIPDLLLFVKPFVQKKQRWPRLVSP